jgi:hypothetical protein
MKVGSAVTIDARAVWSNVRGVSALEHPLRAPNSLRPSRCPTRSRRCLTRLASPICGTGCPTPVVRRVGNPTSSSACGAISAGPNVCWSRAAMPVTWCSTSTSTRSRRRALGAIRNSNSPRCPAVRRRNRAGTCCSARAATVTDVRRHQPTFDTLEVHLIAPVAQGIEHPPPKRGAASSILAGRAILGRPSLFGGPTSQWRRIRGEGGCPTYAWKTASL